MIRLLLGLSIASIVAAACGDEGSTPLGDRLTAQATGTPETVATATGLPTSSVGQSTLVPTPDAATALQIQALRRLILTPEDLPAGFDTLNNQEAQRDAIIAAQAGIPQLHTALERSDLLGGWATLYSRLATPPTFVSSIAYLFGSREGAAAMVSANADIDVADYPAASEAEQVPVDPIGEASVLKRYRTSDGYAYELTWAQGPTAGQVIVRYPEEQPGDAAKFVADLAAVQAQRMATFAP